MFVLVVLAASDICAGRSKYKIDILANRTNGCNLWALLLVVVRKGGEIPAYLWPLDHRHLLPTFRDLLWQKSCVPNFTKDHREPYSGTIGCISFVFGLIT